MQAVSLAPVGPTLSDADYLDMASQALAQRTPAALRAILASAQERPALWESEPGQALLIEIACTALEALSDGDAQLANETLDACPVPLVEQAHNLLLLAFFPDGHVGNLALLDDAALLCLALLTHRMGHRTRAGELLDKLLERGLQADMVVTTRTVREQFAASARTRFKAKLIIWGLDDTLWSGRLADGAPALHEPRAAIISALDERGIVSAICANNDPDAARARLEETGLWDSIVFPRIGPEPRGAVVRQMVDDMLLVPANVLFIDSDPDALAQVAAAAPGILTMTAGTTDCDDLLRQLIDQSGPAGTSRRADYRILEARVADRMRSLSDADFLLQSGIQATYTTRMDNLAFIDRVEELINRADPLNYTETRVVPGTLRELVMNVTDYDVFSAFIWDKYGHHGLDGLVGTVVYHRPSRRPLHLAFSCRIMHIGVEDFLMKALVERYGEIDLSGLAKPLPRQSSAAITYVPFETVREQILAAQAPRDPAKIKLRVMSDCMSGAFHHYSRFQEVIDFDNLPRVFALAGMLTDGGLDEAYPDFLVYNAAVDYMDWRWPGVVQIDPDNYAQALDRFCDLVENSGRKLLVFLPPENAPDHYHLVLEHMAGPQLKQRDRAFNILWREAARQRPAQIAVIELTSLVTPDEMLGHAYHYTPSSLKRLTERMDDWFVQVGGAPNH